jgi:hypothetical protein
MKKHITKCEGPIYKYSYLQITIINIYLKTNITHEIFTARQSIEGWSVHVHLACLKSGSQFSQPVLHNLIEQK